MFCDFHVHTEHSGCSRKHGAYSLIDAYKKAVGRGYGCIGITDHSNYSRYDASFIFNQKKAVVEHNLRGRILVGLEVTIVNTSGKLGVAGKFRNAADFLIISEHCHLNRLFSEFWGWKKKFLRAAKSGNYGKMVNMARKMALLMINGVLRNPGCILGHIWYFMRSRMCYLPEMLDLSGKIFESLSDGNGVLELHSGILRSIFFTDREEFIRKSSEIFAPSVRKDLVLPDEFCRELIRLSREYDINYSFGSDAHKLENIGCVGPLSGAERVYSLIESLGIKSSRMVTPEFFISN